MHTNLKRLLLAAAVVLITSAVFAEPVISVNFAGGESTSATGGGAGQALVTTTAGAVPADNWNNAVGTGAAGGFSPLALNDNSGVPTGATVSWLVNNTWRAVNPAPGGGGNADLMNGYLDVGTNASLSFSVSGLGPQYTNNGYDVYVYFNNDNSGTQGYTADDGTNSVTAYGTSTGGAGGNYPLAGMDPFGGAPGFIGSDASTFATATDANYVLLADLDGPSFTVTGINGGSSSPNRARPNGFQIVAHTFVPEPASIAIWSLIGLGLAGFGYLRLRRRS